MLWYGVSMRIEVGLPKDRLKLGSIKVLEGDTILHVGPALGLADGGTAAKSGNPERSPLKRNGDTPTGEYSGIWVANNLAGPDGAMLRRKYGAYPILLLSAISGDALRACSRLTSDGMFGRSGLALHSGTLNDSAAYAKWQYMRPTNGCVRIQDETHKFIYDLARNQRPILVKVFET